MHENEYKITFDRNRYLIILRSNIPDVYSHNYRQIKMKLDDGLPLKETLNMQSVLIIINSIIYENHQHYYYEKVLEKYSYNR